MPSITLLSSAGRLAALHDPPTSTPVAPESTARAASRPDGSPGPWPVGPPRGAVVCHPHPLHGGNMHNKVVHTLAKSMAAHGLHVVRFDFRGVGDSEGSHDGGRGERDDVRAALDHVAGLTGGPLLMAGFSFGSWVGLSAALDDDRVGALLAVAPPVNYYDYAAIGATERPLAVVYARQDELVPAEAVERWIASCAQPPRVTAVDAAGHLFHGRLSALSGAVDDLLGSLR